MDEYVKVCPRCGHVNPEDSDVCSVDEEFLRFVPTTRATIDEPKGDKPNPVLPSIAGEAPGQGMPIHGAHAEQKDRSPSVTMRYDDPVCYLVVTNLFTCVISMTYGFLFAVFAAFGT